MPARPVPAQNSTEPVGRGGRCDTMAVALVVVPVLMLVGLSDSGSVVQTCASRDRHRVTGNRGLRARSVGVTCSAALTSSVPIAVPASIVTW